MPDLADLWPSVAGSMAKSDRIYGQIKLQAWQWPWWPYRILRPWIWRNDGKPQATTSLLAIEHAGVKPNFGFSSLYIHWTFSSQGCSPAQLP